LDAIKLVSLIMMMEGSSGKVKVLGQLTEAYDMETWDNALHCAQCCLM